MEKIRHDSSYEWLSGESWKEWSASFFSMGWKIWGVVLITELFLFLFFKPTADCGRLRYGWLFIVRPSGLQLLLLFVYRLLTGRQKRVYSRRAMAGCAIFLLTSYAAVMAWVHTSVTLMPMVLLLPMLLTPLYKDRVMTLVQAALLVAAYVLDCVYFIPASSYFPLTTPFIEGSIFVGTVCGMLVALELVNDSAIVNDERSKRDSLTKLYNHESFYEELEYYQRRYEENRERFSLAVIDIDNFKRINDTFGHTVGDTVITDIAGVLQSQFQETDVTARVGGDEFLALMRDVAPKEAEACAAALGREARKKLIGDDAIVEVTLSIGMAVYGEDGRDYETLFAMADRAMYATKREGKDHYSFAGKKQQEGAERERRRDRIEYAPESGQKVDKEFLNFAFSLLSHAKDINGSLNVLIEQIGKKYGLGFAMVFEYREEQQEMVLMNYFAAP